MKHELNDAMDYTRYAVQQLESGELSRASYAQVAANIAQAKALIIIAAQLTKLADCVEDNTLKINDGRP